MGFPDSSCFFAIISTSKLMFILVLLACQITLAELLCWVLYQYAAVIATCSPSTPRHPLLGKGWLPELAPQLQHLKLIWYASSCDALAAAADHCFDL
jgi:hypothetical protein